MIHKTNRRRRQFSMCHRRHRHRNSHHRHRHRRLIVGRLGLGHIRQFPLSLLSHMNIRQHFEYRRRRLNHQKLQFAHRWCHRRFHRHQYFYNMNFPDEWIRHQLPKQLFVKQYHLLLFEYLLRRRRLHREFHYLRQYRRILHR